MKKIILTTALLLGCILLATAKPKTQMISQSLDGDSSFIYIYRGGSFTGAFTNFAIYVDEQKLCKLSNKRFFKVGVKPGSHTISAKRGGVGIGKKETEVQIDVEDGKSYFVSCSMKSSVTRVRLEMQEVVTKTGMKDIADMKVDNCQAATEE